MSWFKREPSKLQATEEGKRVRTEGLWVKCDGCRQIIWKKDLEENLPEVQPTLSHRCAHAVGDPL